MDYYVYITTNKINGKQYIGQHKGRPDDNYLGSGTTILKAINKYGKENFTKSILCFCETREEADIKEREYIQLYNAVNDDNFYNNAEGGTGGDGWRSCQRWLEQHPEEAQAMYKRNGEHLRKWCDTHPEEYKEKCIKPMLEASHKRLKENPELAKQQVIRLNQAKEKWQQEHPEEHQAQVNEWRKAGSIANSKLVICLTTNRVFESQSAAARYYGIPQSNISKCLKGERKSAGVDPDTGEKLFWKFVK